MDTRNIMRVYNPSSYTWEQNMFDVGQETGLNWHTSWTCFILTHLLAWFFPIFPNTSRNKYIQIQSHGIASRVLITPTICHAIVKIRSL